MTLFFGPYIVLEPGRYKLRFDGELAGELKLRLTRASGRDCLRELVLTSFDAPVVLECDEPAEDFEVVGARTNDTRIMRLKSIEVAAVSAAAEDEQSEAPAHKARRPVLARLFKRA
jgi:hypothetical protein